MKNKVIEIALKWKQNPKNKNPNKTDRLINFIKNEDLSEGFLEHIKKELQFVLSKTEKGGV